MSKISRSAQTFIFVFLLSGCVAYTPKDLEVSRLGLVSKNKINSIVTNPIHNSWLEHDFLLVGLSTETDLIKYANHKGNPLRYDGKFCDEIDTPVFHFGLFNEFGDGFQTESINLKNVNMENVANSNNQNAFHYYVIVPLKFSKEVEIYGRPKRKGAIFYKKYDMISNPVDMCFQVGGIDYGFGFESNKAILPANIIQNFNKQ